MNKRKHALRMKRRKKLGISRNATSLFDTLKKFFTSTVKCVNLPTGHKNQWIFNRGTGKSERLCLTCGRWKSEQ